MHHSRMSGSQLHSDFVFIRDCQEKDNRIMIAEQWSLGWTSSGIVDTGILATNIETG